MSGEPVTTENRGDEWVELAPDLLRRVLVSMQFVNCDNLLWSEQRGILGISVMCSDFFGWGVADCESITCAADVELLEQARADLTAVTGDEYPSWLGELYAARRRKYRPASFMLREGSRHRLDAELIPLFDVAEWSQHE